MASGFFAILDDIAMLMDDVAMASKIATKKTAGILGDDLAVNAEKATGFVSSRELPVLWKITKGSFLNKIIIVPLVFLLNVFFPIAIKIALILGGFYLAYEGMEKIIHWIFFRNKETHSALEKNTENSNEAEKKKIKSAVSTDFILSVEIIIIALASVLANSPVPPLSVQILTVSIVALVATVGVYGIVALIVRLDDIGFSLIKRSDNKGFIAKTGNLLVQALPLIIRFLSIVGTIALILVSGGIFAHYIDFLHDFLPEIPSVIREIIFGIVAGTLVYIIIGLVKKTIKK